MNASPFGQARGIYAAQLMCGGFHFCAGNDKRVLVLFISPKVFPGNESLPSNQANVVNVLHMLCCSIRALAL